MRGWRNLHAGRTARPLGSRTFFLWAAGIVVCSALASQAAANEAVAHDHGADVVFSDPALAGDLATTLPAVEPVVPPWREVWLGADATPRAWLVYSGMTIAPYSAIHDDGLRLRFASGYGQYRWQGKVATAAGDRARGSGDVTYVDGLVGYLKRTGPLTTKAFAGVSLASHTIRQLALPNGTGFEPGEEPISGDEVGVKLALEFWLNLGSKGWSSLDLNWTTAHDAYSARWRAAYRLWPTVSLGVEAIANGDGRYDIVSMFEEPGLDHLNRRGGAFLRYEWFGGEVSLAGGLSVSADEGAKPYATLNWITHF